MSRPVSHVGVCPLCCDPNRNIHKLEGGLEMTLDGIKERYHVRGRDNRVAIILAKPGWAAASCKDYWYVSIEDLIDGRWQHRDRSTLFGGMTHIEAIRCAKELYAQESKPPDVCPTCNQKT